jgi:hypothetical protein
MSVDKGTTKDPHRREKVATHAGPYAKSSNMEVSSGEQVFSDTLLGTTQGNGPTGKLVDLFRRLAQ